MEEASSLALLLARFSDEVRESTLRRFAQVQPEDWRWRPRADLLSFADLLKHLIDADHWLFDRLDGGPPSEGVVIAPGDGDQVDGENALAELARLGVEKSRRISALPERDLCGRRFDLQRRGQVDLIQLVLRCNLDHEIHHRGGLQLRLRLKYG
jgi:uncharacterized damage-inducible protein DinB